MIALVHNGVRLSMHLQLMIISKKRFVTRMIASEINTICNGSGVSCLSNRNDTYKSWQICQMWHKHTWKFCEDYPLATKWTRKKHLVADGYICHHEVYHKTRPASCECLISYPFDKFDDSIRVRFFIGSNCSRIVGYIEPLHNSPMSQVNPYQALVKRRVLFSCASCPPCARCTCCLAPRLSAPSSFLDDCCPSLSALLDTAPPAAGIQLLHKLAAATFLDPDVPPKHAAQKPHT